ncbi:hypothetical protein [Runella sp.]|uniref:hypothetical protein n=1 Tax=Runella sp. TaxID=1960881 RepID=UPI003D0A6C7D
MIKSDLKYFNNELVSADLDFLKFQIKLCNVHLISGTGLQRLIDECDAYILLPNTTEVNPVILKPVFVLYFLSDALRTLWLNKKEFSVQLRSMNSGDYNFGVITPKEQYFKDFEFEIFSAAMLVKKGVQVELPQSTEGNDIVYLDIEIQCKHLEIFTRDKIDSILRDFQKSLIKNNKFGVLGLGMDDYMGFTEDSFPLDYEAHTVAYLKRLNEVEIVMREILDSTLPYCPKVLGVYTLNTHFINNDEIGFVLGSTSNSAFCQRPRARAVEKEYQRQAYEIISVFNHRPAFRVF